MKVLITCPKLIQNLDKYGSYLTDDNITYFAPRVIQQLPIEDLLKYVPEYDGWIAGDDIANREILTAGRKGKLRVLVKWGVGIDNVDQNACKDLDIKFTNTPGMFGNEVADVAMGYLINLSRQLHITDREVRKGNWTNIKGFSLCFKNVLVIGFGNIGHNIVDRLLAAKMNVNVYDPYYTKITKDTFYNENKNIKRTCSNINLVDLKEGLNISDIIIIACELNSDTYHLINENTFNFTKKGVYIINVARGAIINIDSIINNLNNKKIGGFASDVFEVEPYDINFALMKYDNCMLGTHNASNTIEGVERTSLLSIKYMIDLLKVS